MTDFVEVDAASVRALGYAAWPILTGPLLVLRCTDCSWRRCAQPHLGRELVQLGQAHITETDGHMVAAEGSPS